MEMFAEAQLKVRNGADVTFTKNGGEDAYSLAISKGNYGLAKEIYDRIKGPSIDKLISEAKDANIKTADEFKKFAAEKYGENYVLMRETGSVQGASNESPRAILFQPNAMLVATFTDHPTDPKKNAIEMMEFNHKTKKFDFQELRFANNEFKVSKQNPTTCVSCHQGRPIWDPWPFWKGAVGGVDDRLAPAQTETSWGNYLVQRDQVGKMTGDGALAKEMLKKIETDKTGYAHLKNISTRFMPSARSTDAPEFASSPDPRNDGKEPLPNQKYTHQLMLRNFDRIAGELMSNPAYKRLKFAVIASISGCFENDADAKKLLTEPEASEIEGIKDSKMARGEDKNTSKKAVLSLYTLDVTMGTNFTKQLSVADGWTMTSKEGNTPFGPFAVGRHKEWQLDRVVKHLRVHDSKLNEVPEDDFKCPVLLEKAKKEMQAYNSDANGDERDDDAVASAEHSAVEKK